MKAHLFILALLVMTSCTTKNGNQSNDKPGAEKTSEKELILYKNEVLHSFSSATEMDSFKISVAGQSIKDGEILLQIKTSTGQVLLNERFAATYLIDFDFDKNVMTEEEYIKNRIDTFFDEKHFKQPAIKSDAMFDENYSSKEIWDDIKSDPTSIGFTYLLGKEDGRHIAYSKKSGKIVLYFNCC